MEVSQKLERLIDEKFLSEEQLVLDSDKAIINSSTLVPRYNGTKRLASQNN